MESEVISTESRFSSQVGKYQIQKRRRRHWYRIVTALSCVVVFCTTYALILPAITMERPRILDCPLAVHTHTADCYDGEGNLICGQADFVVHTHTGACYDTHGELVCPLPEIEAHTHTDACYTEQDILTCGLKESAGHQHTGNCYAAAQGGLICGNEDPEHTHTDECYEQSPLLRCGLEEAAGHFHDESCYTEEQVLVCGSEDTEDADGGADHDQTPLLTCGLEETAGHRHDENCYTVESALICGIEDAEHIHTDECYEQISHLTCGLEETAEHYHSESCYTAENVPADDGENTAHMHTSDCYKTVINLTCGLEKGEGGHTHTDDCYVLTCGIERGEGAHRHTRASCYESALSMTCGKEEVILHRHTDACRDGNGALICGQLEILEHVHGDACFRLLEEAAPAYLYEDDAIAAEVLLPADSGVPADAVLTVRPITAAERSYDYETLVRQAEASVDKAVMEIALYDISFYTSGGEYIPVADTATVSLRFKESILPEGANEVAVLHYQEDADLPVTLEDVDVECGTNDAVSALTFQAEGFSVFGVAALADTGADAGFALTYAYNGTTYTITFMIEDSSGNSISGDYSAGGITAEDAAKYVFSDIAPKIDGYTYTGAVWQDGSASHPVYSVGTNGYDKDTTAVSSVFRLYETEPIESGQWYSKSTDLTITLTYTKEGAADYSGSWAIVNRKNSSGGVAMMADAISSGNRAGLTVTLAQSGNDYYVMDSTVTLWTFEKQSDGAYYISTEVNGKTQYLTIGTHNSAVTLGGTPQSITVSEGSGTKAGTVRLSASNGGVVNLFGGSANQGFGSWNDTSDNTYQTLCRVLDGSSGMLHYDLNLPSLSGKGSSWKTTPYLDGSIQTIIGAEAALFGQPKGFYTEKGTAGIANLYRFDLVPNQTEALYNEPCYDGVMGSTWYGEERFDGWTYTASDGVTYLFEPEAAVTKDENGIIQATASKKITVSEDGETVEHIDDTPVVLPSNAVLTGRWREISSVVMFFVNYKGTILDVEGDVSGRRSDTFTKSVAVGHVFYGERKVGADQLFGTSANQQITGAFSPEFAEAFDPHNPNPQIVIEYLRDCTKGSTTGEGYETSMEIAAPGANSAMVEANTLKLLKETGRTIQVATGNTTSNKPNPVVDNYLMDTDHYQIRWYVMKEQNDSWHIDGVLVAKTAEITVTKTFSGLTETQVSGLLNKSDSAGYHIPVKLGATPQNYLTMTTSPTDDEKGQYTYTDIHSSSMQSYRWVLHAITDELYTLSEENYTLDGYDVVTQVVHYYTDNDQTAMDYTSGSSTAGLKNAGIVGGKTIAVSFNNFYTPAGTGALSLLKRAETIDTSPLQGAVLKDALFELTDQTGKTIASAASNENGAVYFANLQPGTYTLRETQPPAGYEEYTGSWTVEVTKDTSGSIVVTLYENDASGKPTGAGTVCYNSGGKMIYTKVIYNDTQDSTITIVKSFSGLTEDLVEALVSNSIPDNDKGYYIELTRTNDQGETTSSRLYLFDASPDQTGNVYTWTLTNVPVDAQWTLTERNYLLDAYADTVVTVTQRRMVTDKTTGESSTETKALAVKKPSYENGGTTEVPFTFSTDTDEINYSNRTITVNNHYTNTFDLRLRKVDSVTGEPLVGASFHVYGPYDQAKDISNFITYRGIRYYYIGTTAPSGTDGYTTWPGLSLSRDGTATFVYYLDEWQSPGGYIKLDEPLAASVTVSAADDAYSGGVLSMEAPNTKETDVKLALTARKEWDPYIPDGASVTLALYRVAHSERNVPLNDVEDAELVSTLTLNGLLDVKPDTASVVSNASPPQAYESAPWTATWTNLPTAPDDAGEGSATLHYHYFIRETDGAGGFTASYSYITYDDGGGEVIQAAQTQTLRVDGGTFQAVQIADIAETYMVEVTNTAYFELPETGGPGALLFTTGGALLMAVSLLCGYMLRRREERRSAR